MCTMVTLTTLPSTSFHGNAVLFKMFHSDHIHQKKSKQKNRFCFLPGSVSTTYATAIHVCVTSTACLKQAAEGQEGISVFCSTSSGL